MPASTMPKFRWRIDEVAQQLGAEIASAEMETGTQKPSQTDTRQDIIAAKHELRILVEVAELRRHEIIRPKRSDGTAPLGSEDTKLYLTREDLERVLSYVKSDKEAKSQFLKEWSKRRSTGRYTIAQAAELIAAEGNEDEQAVRRRLKSAALNGELLMYMPGRNQSHDYGSKPRLESTVRVLRRDVLQGPKCVARQI